MVCGSNIGGWSPRRPASAHGPSASAALRRASSMSTPHDVLPSPPAHTHQEVNTSSHSVSWTHFKRNYWQKHLSTPRLPILSNNISSEAKSNKNKWARQVQLLHPWLNKFMFHLILKSFKMPYMLTKPLTRILISYPHTRHDQDTQVEISK